MVPKDFRHSDLVPLFAGSFATAFGNFMMMVAVGWMVLERTDSPMSLGLVWATRSAPHLIWGLVAGAAADRFDRKKLLLLAHVGLAVCGAAMGLLVSAGAAEVWHVLCFTFAISSVTTFATTSRQALLVDLAGRGQAMRALSINAVGTRITGVIGGVSSGMVVALLDPHWVFYLISAGFLVGAAATFFVRDPGTRTDRPDSIRRSLVEGIRIIRGNDMVLVLVMMAVVCEILGFSWQALLPVFARDILATGPKGLGVLTSTQSLGGVLAVLALVSLGDFRHKGRLILGVFLLFGVFLVMFAVSPLYAASVVFCALVGAMAAAFDTMQHTMLQLSVGDGQRGRAMGIWLLSIGFGPLGSLAVGAIASVLGARAALALNGTLMILVFGALFFLAPRLGRPLWASSEG